jgi:hypothetical protein
VGRSRHLKLALQGVSVLEGQETDLSIKVYLLGQDVH